MTTAIDTNIIIALWDKNASLNYTAQSALEAAFSRGNLVISAPVFAELMAARGRTESFLTTFLEATGIFVDWTLEERVWRSAGKAFQWYGERRRRQRAGAVRRILADFLIGAHAQVNGYSLLTMDHRLYKAAFPQLKIHMI